MRHARSFLVLAILMGWAWSPVWADKDKPAPDRANVHYGPHERNVFDLWKAPGHGATPLLVFFHGGGFVGGNKTNLDADLLEKCLNAGISVVSSNYRFSTQAVFPAPMLDGARAIQFLRTKARKWGIDPHRIAASGDSAGAGIALWVGFHDDLAAPSGRDRVARESSRLSAVAVFGAQCSYDPRFIREVIGGRAYEHPALPQLYGLKPEELDTPRAHALFEQAAPINYLTADDPPVFLYYTEPRAPLPPGPNTGPTLYYPQFGQPVEGQPKPGQGIHHPRFGEVLKAKLDALHIDCELRHRGDYAGAGRPVENANADLVKFLRKHFHIE